MRNTLKTQKFKRVIALLLAVVIFAGIIPQPMTAKAAVGEYYLKINKGTNVVTVYKQDGTPYTAFVCSTGYATPIGTFQTQAKYRWWTLDGPSYGQYCTRITGSFLFHSVWYHQQTPDSQSYTQYNRLGTTASHGCTRLTTAASKWIYDNCPIGTTVIIFYGTEKDDPFSKPNFPATTTGGLRGWDPTDPDPMNPYQTNKNKPVITVSKKVLVLGKKFGTGNMTCKDSGGFDCTDWVKMTGKVNMKKEGDYPVTYSVVDSWGRTASLSVVYKVRDTKKAYIKGIKGELRRPYNSSYNVKAGITANNIQGTNLTKKIKISIKKPGTKEYHTYKKEEFTFEKVGTYKIKYTVTNPTNKKVTTKIQTVTVVDSSKPILKSEYDWAALAVGQKASTVSFETLMSDVDASLSCGTKLDDRVVITVVKPNGVKATLKPGKSFKLTELGKYKVTYTVKNPTKNTKKNAYLSASRTRALYVVEGDAQFGLYKDLPVNPPTEDTQNPTEEQTEEQPANEQSAETQPVEDQPQQSSGENTESV